MINDDMKVVFRKAEQNIASGEQIAQIEACVTEVKRLSKWFQDLMETFC
jgi:hypothetical protein